jgi:membrane-bound metal-dependent hydrolase YbcI (DUF457 family)
VLGGVALYSGFSVPVALLSAGLCSAAGMLPDIDSDTSKSFQECIYLAAGLGAVMLVQRLRNFGLAPDTVILGGAAMFFFIRFGVGWFIKRVTSHRGMIHSIPAAVLAGQLLFFVATGTIEERLLKAISLTIGYLSHLILDEIYSIDSTGMQFRLKKSFGTALKFYDPKRMPTVMCFYALIVCFGWGILQSPMTTESVSIAEAEHVKKGTISQFFTNLTDRAKTAYQDFRQERQNDIKKEAAEFLEQQKQPEPLIAKPFVAAAVKPPPDSELSLFSKDSAPSIPSDPDLLPPPPVVELPPAMQMIGNEFVPTGDRNFAVPFNRRPAPIRLP